jgi:hypothetical protein
MLVPVKRATHPKFGEGTVVEERDDAGARVLTIDFPQHGRKRLRAEFVELRDALDANPFADAVRAGQLRCRFEGEFVAHADLGPADAPRLAALVEVLASTRQTAFVRSVTMSASPKDELGALWNALEQYGLPETVRWLQLPSPEADLPRVVGALARVTTLHVKGPRDVPPFTLPEVVNLTVEGPSASVVRTLARCELPSLRRLYVVAEVLDSGVLPALVDDAAHWKLLEVIVVAKGIATMRRIADVEALERAVKQALPRVHLQLDLPIRQVLGRAGGGRDVGPTSIESAFLGEDFPIPGHGPPSTDPDPDE